MDHEPRLWNLELQFISRIVQHGHKVYMRVISTYEAFRRLNLHQDEAGY